MAGEGASGPLIVTAQLPPDIAHWATELRRRHYPAERNWLDAHVTLFHVLPPSARSEVMAALAAEASGNPAPGAVLDGVISLGGGTALRLVSPAMSAIREGLADRFHGLLSVQDMQSPRLHVTIQNKVTAQAARELQKELASSLPSRSFRFTGLSLHIYRGGPWEYVRNWPFRGPRRA